MARMVTARSSDDGRAQVKPRTGRDRLRAIARENGFVAAECSPRPDVDEFVSADRTVHIAYGADECILEILVNGQCLFTRERSIADRKALIEATSRMQVPRD